MELVAGGSAGREISPQNSLMETPVEVWKYHLPIQLFQWDSIQPHLNELSATLLID